MSFKGGGWDSYSIFNLKKKTPLNRNCVQFSIVPKQTQLFLNSACVIEKLGVTSLVAVGTLVVGLEPR